MKIGNEVVVIDYGVGNLLSVRRGLERCGAVAILTADPEQVLAARRVVLPGVGAFGNAMHELGKLGLIDVLRELPRRSIPLLGICLGMQLLLDESEEFGVTAGLGIVPGRVIAIPPVSPDGDTLKIPHIGWSDLRPSNSGIPWGGTVLRNIVPGEATYFVHSFMAVPRTSEHCIADCEYGGHRISAVIGFGSVTGCQFHPEKSGDVGLRILAEFVNQ